MQDPPGCRWNSCPPTTSYLTPNPRPADEIRRPEYRNVLGHILWPYAQSHAAARSADSGLRLSAGSTRLTAARICSPLRLRSAHGGPQILRAIGRPLRPRSAELPHGAGLPTLAATPPAHLTAPPSATLPPRQFPPAGTPDPPAPRTSHSSASVVRPSLRSSAIRLPHALRYRATSISPNNGF